MKNELRPELMHIVCEEMTVLGLGWENWECMLWSVTFSVLYWKPIL